ALQRPARLYRVRVAVHRQDRRAGIEDRLRIAAGAERAVDDPLAGFRRQRSENFGEKNRNVTGRSANGVEIVAVARHHSGRSPMSSRLVPCRSRNSRARTSAPWAASREGSQIWKKL